MALSEIGFMTADRILVTGATGFIGREVVDYLLDRGEHVTVVARTQTNCPERWREHSRITILAAGDLASADFTTPDIQNALGKTQAIIHLAGLAHVGANDGADVESQFMRANATTTERLVEAARINGIKTFIHLSSLAAITANIADTAIDDTQSPAPTTAYGRSKRAAELHLYSLVETGAFAISLRPPLVVGANAPGNWGSLQALAKTGVPLPLASLKNKRSFISIQSLSEAIAILCSSRYPPQLSGEYCIADTELLSTAEVLSDLREGMGMQPRLFSCPPGVIKTLGTLLGRRRQMDGLTGSLPVDPSRFYSQFNFRPSISLRKAIRCSGSAYAHLHERIAT